jgi:probable F420-dependent oxidoreductase
MSFQMDTVLPPGPVAAGESAPQMEAMGYDGLFSTETTSDPFLDLMVPATNTERALLGTNLAIAFARSPYVTAVLAWRLQEASRGRFVLGLGTQVKGHIERRFGMHWEAPGPRFREYVEAIRSIWDAFASGGQPDHRGRFYTHTLMTPFFRSPPIDQPPPPIWLAAVNPYNAKTVGLVADGILVHPVHSKRYLDEVLFPAIDEGLEESKRERSEITVMCPVFIIAGKTPEERSAADGFVRSQIAFYGSTRSYRKIFETHGWDEVPAKLHELMAKGDAAGMAAQITDEMLEEFAVVADPDDLTDEIRARYEGVADRLYLYNTFASIYATDEGRLREVITALRAS